MKKLLVLVVLLSAVSLASVSAQTRIATLDLVQVINHYYKADQVFGQLNEEQKVYQRGIQSIQADLQKEGAEYEQLVKSIQDPSLSQAARDAKTDQARQKQAQIQQMQDQLQTKYQQSQRSLQSDKSLAETSLVEDVSKAASSVAAGKGFDIVLDKSGASLTSNSPIVFYVSPAVPDLTNEVIARLNAGAPRSPAAVTPAMGTTH